MYTEIYTFAIQIFKHPKQHDLQGLDGVGPVLSWRLPQTPAPKPLAGGQSILTCQQHPGLCCLPFKIFEDYMTLKGPYIVLGLEKGRRWYMALISSKPKCGSWLGLQMPAAGIQRCGATGRHSSTKRELQTVVYTYHDPHHPKNQ